jgi:hypothetical protein
MLYADAILVYRIYITRTMLISMLSCTVATIAELCEAFAAKKNWCSHHGGRLVRRVVCLFIFGIGKEKGEKETTQAVKSTPHINVKGMELQRLRSSKCSSLDTTIETWSA